MKSWYRILVLGCVLLAACTPGAAQPINPVGGANQGQATVQLPPTGTAVFTPTATMTPAPTQTSTPPPTATPAPVRFAVIGDYGAGGKNEAKVAKLVKSWDPEFVITVGDNNYPSGAADTMDENVGQYYQEFIFPYQGTYGPGATTNRFFPTIGNHDLDDDDGQTYLNYFTLPGNERYYEFTWGPIHFFALNSDSREVDGVGMSSVQAQWLQKQMAVSTAPWQVVFFHHAPYSSGKHGPVDWMRWPFAEWGADVVLAGHDHTYERLSIDGIPYFVNGVGGGAIYDFEEISDGSQARYNDGYGAMLVTVSPGQILFQFFTVGEDLIDSFSIQK